MKIGFIGLGVMGFPMAGHLKNAGFDVVVWNRTTEKSNAWVSVYGGERAASARALGEASDIVITCVGNDDDLEEVLFGEAGASLNASDETVYVDHSTVSAHISEKFYERLSGRFIDAPISGGQAGAENGTLAIMCGGQENAFAKVKPVLKSYGKIVELIGASGSGQRAKMCNQIAISGLIQGLAESLSFAKSAGLNTDKLLNVISGGAAGSWQMQNRGETMVDGKFDFGFRLDLMRKDLGLVFDEAENLGALLPITKIVSGYYDELSEAGHGDLDTSALMMRMDK